MKSPDASLLTNTHEGLEKERARIRYAQQQLATEYQQLQTALAAIAAATTIAIAQQEALAKINVKLNELAAKTNLLSINAAIIAEQAAGKGDGLHVIAKEIQAVSEEARYTGKEIEDYTNTLAHALQQVTTQNVAASALMTLSKKDIDSLDMIVQESEKPTA